VAPHEITDRLTTGEEVLWWGRGFLTSPGESAEVVSMLVALVLGCPFALGGFLHLLTGGLRAVPLSMLLMAVGAGIVLMAYAAAATREGRAAHTLYAITSHRLLFLDWRWPRGGLIREIPLTQTLYPTIRVGSEGIGTVSFRPGLPRRGSGYWRPFEPWAFTNIQHPRAVHEVYARAADEAQRTQWRAVSGQASHTAG
jgi:hypothetical protein